MTTITIEVDGHTLVLRKGEDETDETFIKRVVIALEALRHRTRP